MQDAPAREGGLRALPRAPKNMQVHWLKHAAEKPGKPRRIFAALLGLPGRQGGEPCIPNSPLPTATTTAASAGTRTAYPHLTYTSKRKKAQASTGLGTQEAQAARKHWGGRLSVFPHTKDKFGMSAGRSSWPRGQQDRRPPSLWSGAAVSSSQQHS